MCNLLNAKVTVLIASYNHGHYLTETIESIIENLNYLRKKKLDIKIQVILVDDGSFDNTSQIVRNIMDKLVDDNISFVYIYQENQGQSAAYQNVLDKIEGDYIFLLDSDDRFLPNKIFEVMNIFENNNVGMVQHPMYVINSKGERTGEIRPKAAILSSGDVRNTLRETGRIVTAPTSGLCFRRDVFLDIHPNPLFGLPSAADSYLGLAAGLITTIFVVDRPLSEYRQHEESHYLKRLTSISGLKRTIEIQRKIQYHLNLSVASQKNSYFNRHNFVYVKMTGSLRESITSLYTLLKSLFFDKYLPIDKKFLLIIFWLLIGFLPKKLFWSYWIYFQKKHTGFNKLNKTVLKS